MEWCKLSDITSLNLIWFWLVIFLISRHVLVMVNMFLTCFYRFVSLLMTFFLLWHRVSCGCPKWLCSIHEANREKCGKYFRFHHNKSRRKLRYCTSRLYIHTLSWKLKVLLFLYFNISIKACLWHPTHLFCKYNIFSLSFKPLGGVWFVFSNNYFQFLNSISRISIHFFTHTYFQKCF